jgi:hypothetical protein
MANRKMAMADQIVGQEQRDGSDPGDTDSTGLRDVEAWGCGVEHPNAHAKKSAFHPLRRAATQSRLFGDYIRKRQLVCLWVATRH